MTIEYPDQAEFDTLVQEIFKLHTYYADLPTNTPTILDAGAHIGLSTLYLHHMYPNAHFVCIEPDPKNIVFLRKNLAANMSDDQYTIIPAALSAHAEEKSTTLYQSKVYGVFSSLISNGWTHGWDSSPIQVETVLLSSLLQKKVDLLKMDIEGSEIGVLLQAGSNLSNISSVVMEFHETPQHPLTQIQKLLTPYFASLDIQKDDRKEKEKGYALYTISAR